MGIPYIGQVMGRQLQDSSTLNLELEAAAGSLGFAYVHLKIYYEKIYNRKSIVSIVQR